MEKREVGVIRFTRKRPQSHTVGLLRQTQQPVLILSMTPETGTASLKVQRSRIVSKPEKYLVVDHYWNDYNDDWGIDDSLQANMNKLDSEGYDVYQIEELCLRSRLNKVTDYNDRVMYEEQSLGNRDRFDHDRLTRVYYRKRGR
tara:strand:- start:906 stop:1337 length:432 start_codon:yes stop_codon:yes gene_type:complete